ncbi:hypothetical protein PVA45_03385 [Entomospira entomophila]|uniref:1-acyl-sn-glycerol-3-phosphate acyltransferase n=1 Tax=Entomospira entomophila TaxID=2719988 RepID=A0A968GCQ6_9SPIO|nr:hypothetical protein [Entomospira entomophilus]NIZ40554.1 hypothetical protein [Entomospira entomophilus]WDI36112.1 hypothetical protein PVA45_03385 [Entomospira entomophilus]
MSSHREVANTEVHNKVYQFYMQSPEWRDRMIELLAQFPKEEEEEVTAETVYKAGSLKARRIADLLAAQLILSGSGIVDPQHLEESWKLSQSGKSVLVLCEHFSNFDLTNITYLTDHEPLIGEEFANKLTAMAGVKLSKESDRFITSFIKIYNRIVIIPSRTLNNLSAEEREEYNRRMGPINMAALKEMTKRKMTGHPILVFPTGTRTRPNKPETAQAVKEIYSYIRSFDYIQFLSLNGVNLKVAEESMSQDEPQPNVIMMGAAKPMSSEEFLEQAEIHCSKNMNLRDFVPEYVMSQLRQLHEYVEPIRLAKPNAI